MILDYIHKDGNKERIEINETVEVVDVWKHVNTSNKLDFIKTFIPAYRSKQKLVLFDPNHKQLLEYYENNDLTNLLKETNLDEDARLLFFTSGSSGFPLGAFKTQGNISKEVQVLANLVKKHEIKRVVVTVPFVHIYGILAGLLLPDFLGVKLIIKEDFLPYELLEESKDPHTLVITTPVFIKALSYLQTQQKMQKSLFICSTGPLHKNDVKEFEGKYDTTVMQLFGSTETGGIAYKFHDSSAWKPLQGVEVTSKDEKLNVSSPYVSRFLLNKKLYSPSTPFETEDLIEVKEEGFVLLGRSNKIIKIAGKRISALQIESILETLEVVETAVVELIYKKELLRSEQIIIYLKASEKVLKSRIKSVIHEQYGTLTIPFKIIYLDEIKYSSMGKKILFKTDEG